MTPVLFALYQIDELVTNDGSNVGLGGGDILGVTYPERDFSTQGLGALSDAISCRVIEERNGPYELEMTYPIDGIHYGDIKLSSIILAEPAAKKTAQPFRVYKISRPLGGVVTVYAEHISYQLSYIPVTPFTATTALSALYGLKNNSAEGGPFSFTTDKNTTATFTVKAPASLRSLLGGQSGSILDVYGGEYEFDRYTVRLWESRGSDNGVSIRYGKNLTDISQDESIANTVTGICPYWQNEEGDTVVLPETTLYSANYAKYPFNRTIVKDFSGSFQEKPTVEQLRSAANSYIKSSGVGVPDVSIDVSFVDLSQASGYEGVTRLETVNLCDTVSVEFEELGVSASSKVIKTDYDVLAGRYNSVTLGSVKSNMAATVAQAINEATDTAVTSAVKSAQAAVDAATSAITGVDGGYVVTRTDADGHPYEILIMDTDDIETAEKVWRWNKNGLGYSSTGYNGAYELAMTSDGQIVADFISTGTLNASLVNVINILAENIQTVTKEYGSTENWSSVELAWIGAYLLGRITKETAIAAGADVNGDGQVDNLDMTIVGERLMRRESWNAEGGTYTAKMKCDNPFSVFSVSDGDSTCFSAGIHGAYMDAALVGDHVVVNKKGDVNSKSTITSESILMNNMTGSNTSQIELNEHGLTFQLPDGGATIHYPNTGMLVQSGTQQTTFSSDGWTYVNVTFPKAYATVPFVSVHTYSNGSGNRENPMIDSITTTGFRYGLYKYGLTATYIWQAIGNP